MGWLSQIARVPILDTSKDGVALQLKRTSRMSLNLKDGSRIQPRIRCCGEVAKGKLIVYRIPCDFVFPPATSWMETPRRVLGERVPVQRPAPTHMPAKTSGQHTQLQWKDTCTSL